MLVIAGDCLVKLPKLAAGGERFHCCVTDPPYHLTSIVKRFGGANAAPAQFGKDGAYARASAGFMGKMWDGGDIAFRPETWRAVYDVLLPGSYLVAFASTRGYHRMVCAIEDAGFIIHPMLGWIFGQGFPKAHKIGTPNAEGFRYGLQSLKPALEPICLAQKPMVGTGTENWVAYGVGGLNIDASRVGFADDDDAIAAALGGRATGRPLSRLAGDDDPRAPFVPSNNSGGRWPANVITSYPEDEYILRPDVTAQQRQELFRWLHENA